MKFEKGSREYLMFAAYYKMVQAFYVIDCSSDYWDAVISSESDFLTEYADIPLAKLLCDAFTKYLEEQDRENRVK